MFMKSEYPGMTRLLKTLDFLCTNYMDVVMVPGNHEYYHSDIDFTNIYIQGIANRFPNFHPFIPGIFKAPGIHIVGAPLWFRETPNTILYRHLLNDFSQIDEPQMIFTEEKKQRKFLLDSIETEIPDIVVTHSIPTTLGINGKYKGSKMNDFYVNPIFDEIPGDTDPPYFVFGHSHASARFTVENSEFICNPYGYHGYEVNPDFDDNLILEI